MPKHAATTHRSSHVRIEAGTPFNFDEVPDSAYLRQEHLVGKPQVTSERAKKNKVKQETTNRNCGPVRPRQGRTGILPFSAATLWRKVADKTFPAPIKLSERVTCWRCGDVRAWLAKQSSTEA